MSNDHIVEFRLHLKRMDYAAEVQGGHKIYQKWRTLDALSKKRKLTDSEIKLSNKLRDQERKLYEKAWDRITN